MEEPLTWAGIWLAVAVTFGIGEMAMAGTFFLAPFAVGATLAALASLFQVPVLVGWLVFLVGSIAAFIGMKPLANRLDIDLPQTVGAGANRLVGHEGTVIGAIAAGPNAAGKVRAGAEEWTAESRSEIALPVGTTIQIVEVRGTRVVVEPAPQAGLDNFL